ncbi:MAG: hypothetical protein H7837_02190 [Magnetococcus sp. MYC-9]
MKNFIRGALLGSMTGVLLFWYAGIGDHFPAIVAIIIFVGILIPLESQERRMEQVLRTVEEIQRRLEIPETAGAAPLAAASSIDVVDAEEEPTFIPSMQADASTGRPAPQKKRTVDRSLGDVAKKLSSMQGKG